LHQIRIPQQQSLLLFICKPLNYSTLFSFLLILISSPVFSQSGNTGSPVQPPTQKARKLIQIADKFYIDTSWSSAYRPDSIFLYFYNVRGKYPESSETIQAKATQYLLHTGLHFTGSGYITFRFFIDSAGQMMKRVEILQTDEFYKEYFFPEGLVWTLYDFLKTLHDWKPARLPKGLPPFYINLMSFKIHEGHIDHIIP